MTELLKCDVLIVGGGPAGLSVASHLSAEFSSIVVHQDSQIGLPVRTSGGTWQRDMVALGIPPALYQVIDQLDFYSDTQEARFSVQKDKMAVMDVTAVYRHLAELASLQNNRLFLGAKFLSTERQSDGLYKSHIRSRDLGDVTVVSRIIVDASGWHCAVLEALDLAKAPMRRGIGIEFEFDRGDFAENRAILFVGSTALTGYGWVFPAPNNRLRLGIGVIHPDTELSPRAVMQAFVKGGHAARFGLEIPPDYEVNAGVIPSEDYDPKLVFGTVVRTGDAANFATPTVGEGIRQAIGYGRMLGERLTEYLKGDGGALGRYEAACAKELTKDYRFGLMVNKRIAGYSPTRWDKSVRRLARLSEVEMTELVRSRFHWRTIARTVWLSILAKFTGK